MNIDPLAAWYRCLEYCAFGQALERRRFAYLERLAGAQRILTLGEGDGRALARLRTIAPDAYIDVIEVSGAMIGLARRRVGETPHVHFLQQDARNVELTRDAYDGVVIFFFLDCFTEPEARRLVERLAHSLKPGGILLMSDFAVPERGWQRWHALAWIRTMYLFFRMTTALKTGRLPPIGKLLTDAGMTLVEEQQERAGMMISQVWRSQF
jgi:SAM-dependent methyltransferase